MNNIKGQNQRKTTKNLYPVSNCTTWQFLYQVLLETRWDLHSRIAVSNVMLRVRLKCSNLCFIGGDISHLLSHVSIPLRSYVNPSAATCGSSIISCNGEWKIGTNEAIMMMHLFFYIGCLISVSFFGSILCGFAWVITTPTILIWPSYEVTMFGSILSPRAIINTSVSNKNNLFATINSFVRGGEVIARWPIC